MATAAIGMYVDQGQTIGLAFGPFVADIDANVVAVRDVPLKTKFDILIRLGGNWQHGGTSLRNYLPVICLLSASGGCFLSAYVRGILFLHFFYAC